MVPITSLSPEDYFQRIYQQFRDAGSPDVAQGQMAYLRHQFDFFGLKCPQWLPMTKAFHKEHGLPGNEEVKILARRCFEDDHRELHYFALETVQNTLPRQPAEFIDFLEELICTRSWWDTVDWLAKLVGIHFRRYPERIKPITEAWMDSGNFWLQRVCLIFQLLYKEKTDAPLLFGYVRRVATSKEFFLQKGAGWALRQYAKIDPEAVRAFVHSERLAPLTRREAMKRLRGEGLRS